MAFDADPRWLGDAAWPAPAWPVDASSGAEPPYVVHAPPVDAPAAPAVDLEAFKGALARLASGVAIIACWDGATPRGLLVSSITGLSVDPPRFLFCVRKEASSHDALLRAGVCGVTILSAHQADEAHRFATPTRANERFTDPRWTLDGSAPPLFTGGLSVADCVIDETIEAGSHSILIVTARSLSVEGGQPLIAYDRAFRDLA